MKELETKNFNELELKLANPEKILKWSYGEVKKSETINYRTQRSEREGLFDEKIFGPEKDYECYCGKYKGVRYKGIVCEKCGVELTKSIVRRQRMGHIELASPVAHIWFLRSTTSRMSLIFNIPMGELEKVIYFSGYIITSVDKNKKKELLSKIDEEFKAKVKKIEDVESIDKLKNIFKKVKEEINDIKEGFVIDELMHSRLSEKYQGLYIAEIGSEAIYNLMKKINLSKLENSLQKELLEVSNMNKPKLIKRITLIKSMNLANIRPEWMFFTRIPVIPPTLRPIVALGAGKHASSDINDLYRRVINRNNRLKKLINIGAPDVILRNEKRILQEAVDALIDNSMRRNSASAAMSVAQRRPLKSLTDSIKGKQGIFRANLLGKRVDYSGRSVIIVGPELSLDEVGLPKKMALELFKPFIISKLIFNGHSHNIKTAAKLIDEETEEVWAYLEEIVKDRYVLLNRAPTLHRLGVLAFKPILVEGESILLHPLVCPGFNADFDGDQMAVHLPISVEAQKEASEIMSSSKNIVKPGNNELIVSSRLDIILGTYWATKIIEKGKGENKVFHSPNDAINAWDFDIIDLRANIKVLGTNNEKYSEFSDKIFETSVGRLLFNSILPSDYPFLNKVMDQKSITKLETDLIAVYGLEGMAKILDSIKKFGFEYATKSGATWSNYDLSVPKEKKNIIEKTNKEVAINWEGFNDGFMTKKERKKKNIEAWFKAKEDIEEKIEGAMDLTSSIWDIIASGARGKKGNLSTMIGMKGIVSNVLNEAIEFPIKSSIKEGLGPIEYFITTHGSRKGVADTALNTAKAGYLTRRLFDVAQDVIITDFDCKTKKFINLTMKDNEINVPFSKTARGRYIAEDIKDKNNKILFKKGHFLSILDANLLTEKEIKEVKVRSPITCELASGICQKCYGMDMGGDLLIDLGEAIGTIAAQAIGEPGTQLTMRTFHAGGIATRGGDITSGLPRIEEIFERRKPKVPASIVKFDGEIISIDQVYKKTLVTISHPDEKVQEKIYTIPFRRTLIVKVGDKVKAGEIITDGSANLEELLKYAGREETQEYIVAETVKIYELQGSSVARKHMEVIISRMFSRSKIVDSGDSEFIENSIVENSDLEAVNSILKEKGKNLAKGELLILGITEVSLSRKSFLSAMSFQHTVRILINASLKGAIDELKGLKENVIIGNLIPAGTNFEGSKKQKMIEEVQKNIELEELKEEEEKEMEVKETNVINKNKIW